MKKIVITEEEFEEIRHDLTSEFSEPCKCFSQYDEYAPSGQILSKEKYCKPEELNIEPIEGPRIEEEGKIHIMTAQEKKDFFKEDAIIAHNAIIYKEILRDIEWVRKPVGTQSLYTPSDTELQKVHERGEKEKEHRLGKMKCSMEFFNDILKMNIDNMIEIVKVCNGSEKIVSIYFRCSEIDIVSYSDIPTYTLQIERIPNSEMFHINYIKKEGE